MTAALQAFSIVSHFPFLSFSVMWRHVVSGLVQFVRPSFHETDARTLPLGCLIDDSMAGDLWDQWPNKKPQHANAGVLF
jgi:hypothetical protein